MTTPIEALKNAIAVQGQDGNWNYSEYMLGMYNGMEFALAMFEDRQPEYRDAQFESKPLPLYIRVFRCILGRIKWN